MTTTQPRRRAMARRLLTPHSENLLDTMYAGQVRAAVIERALRRMAEADRRAARKTEREGAAT